MGNTMRSARPRSGVSAVTGRQLGQLDQDISGGGRIEEGDPRSAVPDTRRFVAQRDALLLELRQRAIDVLHLEADVKEARALLADPLRDARFGSLALEQLDVRLADRQHGETRLADLLLVLEGQAERVLQQFDRLPERVHGDGDVLDALDVHGRSSELGWPRMAPRS